MRQPSGDKDGKFSNRGYWLALLEGPNESLNARAELEFSKEPEIPEALAYVHGWWTELDIGRRYGMNGGAEPVSYADLEAWRRLTDRDIVPEEVEALLLVDRIVLNPGPRDDGNQRRR